MTVKLAQRTDPAMDTVDAIDAIRAESYEASAIAGALQSLLRIAHEAQCAGALEVGNELLRAVNGMAVLAGDLQQRIESINAKAQQINTR